MQASYGFDEVRAVATLDRPGWPSPAAGTANVLGRRERGPQKPRQRPKQNEEEHMHRSARIPKATDCPRAQRNRRLW